MHLQNWAFSALVFVTACTSAPPTDSGIGGRVTAGPSCPVSRPEAPCPDLPFAATLSILTDPGRKAVATVTADDLGYYKVVLRAGSYVIHPLSPGAMPYASDIAVQVRAGQFTKQDIVYDTGIR